MKLHYDDTIVAPATIPGTGALTIIRISGPEALSITDRVVSFSSGSASQAPGYTLKYGHIAKEDGSPLDDVVVSIFKAPHSYTGEDSAEISAHASSYIASEILSRLVSCGARMAEPGEFTKRAFLNGKMDLSQAEAVADVISARSEAAHRIAYSQLKGGFSRELEEMRQELLEMTSLLELELDFSEEEVEFASRDRLTALLDGSIDHIGRLSSSFRIGNAIKEGVPVAIVGAANAGKSTLLNHLLGEDRAIVSPIAGTTRDTIEETFILEGVALRLVDTAGLRDTDEEIEKMGIGRTLEKISKASILLALLDCTSSEEEILSQASFIQEKVDSETQTVIWILNKVDICEAGKVDSIHNKIVSLLGKESIAIKASAKTGAGLETVSKVLGNAAKAMLSGSTEGTLVSNIRHYDALRSAGEALKKAKEALCSGVPTDLVAEDLREAISDIGQITGMAIDSQEVLNNIFAHHCIGK